MSRILSLSLNVIQKPNYETVVITVNTVQPQGKRLHTNTIKSTELDCNGVNPPQNETREILYRIQEFSCAFTLFFIAVERNH